MEDAERLLSSDMADYMSKKGFQFESRYIRVLANWRKATERSLRTPAMPLQLSVAQLHFG